MYGQYMVSIWSLFFANESRTSTASSALHMLSVFMYMMWCLALISLKELPPKIVTKLVSEFGYKCVLQRWKFLYGHCMVSIWSLLWPYTDHTPTIQAFVPLWSVYGHCMVGENAQNCMYGRSRVGIWSVFVETDHISSRRGERFNIPSSRGRDSSTMSVNPSAACK